MFERRVAVMGIGGHAVALDMKTGVELWRTRLGSSRLVSIQCRGTLVLAAAGGEVYCLDAASGREIWHNKMSGLGTGPVCFGSEQVLAYEEEVQHELQY